MARSLMSRFKSSEFDWSRYWQAPEQLTAFAKVKTVSSYDVGELATLFDQILETRQADGPFLDLACGNGAAGAALLAAAKRQKQGLTIEGIDSARISFPNDLTPKMTFSQSAVENAQLPEDYFGGIVSCFGFEFCPPSATL